MAKEYNFDSAKFGPVYVEFKVADREGCLVDVVNIYRKDLNVMICQVDMGDARIADVNEDLVNEWID